MKNKNQSIGLRILGVFTALLLLVNTLGIFPINAGVGSQVLATWRFTETNPNVGTEIKATTVAATFNQNDFILTSSGGATLATTASNTSVWRGLPTGQYWELRFSTIGYQDINLRFKTFSTSTGPNEYEMQYSVETGPFVELAESPHVVSRDSANPNTISIDLPSAANNQSLVTVRLISRNGASGGNNRLINIDLTGEVAGAVTKVATPTITPSSSNQTNDFLVTISTATADADIYYTTDGTTPTAASTSYTVPFEINTEGSTTVKAIAVKAGLDDSEVATITYNLSKTINVIPFAVFRKTAHPYTYGPNTFVEGVIVANPSANNYYLQDETGGMLLYTNPTGSGNFSTLSGGTNAKIGQKIRVKVDRADNYGNLTQIIPAAASPGNPTIWVLSEDNEIKYFEVTLQAILSGTYEYAPVIIRGVTLTRVSGTGNVSHSITKDGLTVTYRGSLPTGIINGMYDIYGVASRYGTEIQVMPTNTPANTTVDLQTPTIINEMLGDNKVIAQWQPTAPVAPATTWNPAPASGGVNKDAAVLTTSAKPGTGGNAMSNGGYSTDTWNGTAGSNIRTKYWQFTISTLGFRNININTTQRSSNTGPSDFMVEYSVDGGVSFRYVPTTLRSLPGNTIVTDCYKNIILPDDASNKAEVIVRISLFSDASANGGTIASGGTSQIISLIVKGDEYYGPDDVAPVIATPDSGRLAIGATISLATMSSGADVYYTTDIDSPTPTWVLYSTPLVFNGNPLSIKTKAAKGAAESPVKLYVYLPAALPQVLATPPSGSKLAYYDEVYLTVYNHPAATIKYSVTKNFGETGETTLPEAVYSTALTFLESEFPIRISAFAEESGYDDSPEAVFIYEFKPSGGERIYFGQIHSHSNNSDGSGSLNEAYDWAKNNAKLDFFAVTDHSNSFDASSSDPVSALNLTSYNAANPRWQAGKTTAASYLSPDFISVYAYEMTWSGGPGHINTYNTTGFVSRNNSPLNVKANDAGLRAYYEILKAHPDSISQFNHPGPTFGNFNNFNYFDPVIDQRITLLEVGNGEGAVGGNMYWRSYDQYDLALQKGWHVAPTNNQDNHLGLWGNSNTCRTAIWTNDLSVDGLYNALRDRRVYATEDENLEIYYSLNDRPLGTIINVVPTQAHFVAEISDPDVADRIVKVAIVTNSGEIYTVNPNAQSYILNYTINNPSSGYYYIKVVQADGHIAVTAPVWLGQGAAVGINTVKLSVDMPVTNESLNIITELFNAEDEVAVVEKMTYALKGQAPFLVNNTASNITANSNLTLTAAYTPLVAEETFIVVTATIRVKGTTKDYSYEIPLNVFNEAELIYVGIDGSHHNEYVSGYYANYMGNFITIAARSGIRVVVLNTSSELIAALNNPKYQAVLFTVPSRRIASGGSSTGRVPYDTYSSTELAAVSAFAERGGMVIVSGWGDFYESYANVMAAMSPSEHMAAQQNALLQAAGSSLRVGDDEAKDNVSHGSDSTARLYLTFYNGFTSPLLAGVRSEQIFSQYAGTTVYAVDGSGNPLATLPNSITPVVSGHLSSFSSDDDGDGFGLGLSGGTKIPLPKYDSRILLMAHETVEHSSGERSIVIVAGGAFMSNYEVQVELENYATLPYSNYNIVLNMLELIKPVVITDIAAAKLLPPGTKVIIEGIATTNVYNGLDENGNTGFFDCIYVQDSTGGINLFPVSSGVSEGQKIRVYGTVSSYQDEIQLAVERVVIRDYSINKVTPTNLTITEALEAENTGKLIKIEGIVTAVYKDATGNITQITVVDPADATKEIAIYINSYITKGVTIDPVTIGDRVIASGIDSIGENKTSNTDFLPRLRIRDRSEITVISSRVLPTGVTLNVTSINLAINSTYNLIATLSPDTATATLTWESSNPTIATVDSAGLVKALKKGKVTITVRTENGLTASAIVNVNNNGGPGTGDAGAVWLVLTLMSLCGTIFAVSSKKRIFQK